MRSSLCCTAALFATAFATDALASVRLTTADGVALSWPVGSTISLRVDPAHAPTDGDTLVKIIDQAFATWNQASAGVPKASAVIEAATGADAENTHRVQVINEDWPYDDTTLAVTTYTYSRNSGQMVDADIIINGTGPCFAIGDTMKEHCYDLLSVLTHEAGHFLGLDHTTSTPAAVMYPVLAAGDASRRVLSDDDKQGIIASYGAIAGPTQSPSGGSARTSQTGTSGATPTYMPSRQRGCTQTTSQAASLWAAALFTLALLKKKSKHAAVVGALVALVAASAEASSQVRPSLHLNTESLVVGRAKKAHSYVDPKLNMVVTEYTIETVACLSAQCEGEGRFIVLGGEVNGLVTRVAGENNPDDKMNIVFDTTNTKSGIWKKVHEMSLPLNLLHTLEARGLLTFSKHVSR